MSIRSAGRGVVKNVGGQDPRKAIECSREQYIPAAGRMNRGTRHLHPPQALLVMPSPAGGGEQGFESPGLDWPEGAPCTLG